MTGHPTLVVLRCLQRTLRACYRSVLDVSRKRPHRQLWPPSLYLTLSHRTPQLHHDFFRFPTLPTQSRVVSRSDSLFKLYQKMPSLLGNLPFALFSTVERVAGRETYGTGQASQPVPGVFCFSNFGGNIGEQWVFPGSISSMTSHCFQSSCEGHNSLAHVGVNQQPWSLEQRAPTPEPTSRPIMLILKIVI